MKLPRVSIFNRLAAVALTIGALAAPASAAEIAGISITSESGTVRLVIESDTPLAPSVFALAEQSLRLVLDFPRMEWAASSGPAVSGQIRGAGAGLISQYRFAQNSQTTSRLVLDLVSPAQIVSSFALAPNADTPRHQLVVEVAPASLESFVAASGAAPRALLDASISAHAAVPPAVIQAVVEAAATQPVPAVIAPPAPAEVVEIVDVIEAVGPATGVGGPEFVIEPDVGSGPTPDAVIVAAPLEKPVIVIDAGHGDHDPGTIGVANGTHEKRVTLAASLQLRDILLATGRYEVHLTRTTDVFLELEDRVAFARNHDADLYISLHADASSNHSTRGATVYTIDARGQQRTRQFVQNNSWSIVDQPQTAEVGNILLDLSMTDTKNQSSAFAEMLTTAVAAVGPVLRDPHREKNLFVLLAPDVPAVLLEMGFMSNATDESNLNSSGYRDSLMRAVAGAIDGYFSQRRRNVAEN